MDHDRRADLQRPGAEPGRHRARFMSAASPFPWSNFGYVTLISPAWLVTDVQSTAYGLGEDDQRRARSRRGRARLLLGSAIDVDGLCGSSGRPDGADAVAAVRRDADERERVPPCLRARHDGDCTGPRAPYPVAAGPRIRRDRVRLLRSGPGHRSLRRSADGGGPRSGVRGPSRSGTKSTPRRGEIRGAVLAVGRNAGAARAGIRRAQGRSGSALVDWARRLPGCRRGGLHVYGGRTLVLPEPC